jgi:hypothetical protein
MEEFCLEHPKEQCCLDRKAMEENPKKSDHMGILIIIVVIILFLSGLFFALIMSKKKKAKVLEPEVAQIKRMRVIHAYSPTFPDELELKPGAILHLLKTFDDGWGLGMTENGIQGAFPLVCTVEVSQQDIISRPDMKISRRVSSM